MEMENNFKKRSEGDLSLGLAHQNDLDEKLKQDIQRKRFPSHSKGLKDWECGSAQLIASWHSRSQM